MKSNLWVVAGLAALGLVALNCKSLTPATNSNPIISSISGASTVSAGGSVSLTCNATDPDGDPLTYSWSCTEGTLSSSTGRSVTWYAPEVSGSASVSVTVRDGQSGSDSQDKTIAIQPLTTTIIDWDGAVQAGYYKYWPEYIKSDYRVHGSFSVDAHDITFLILDASNYENWCNNNSYTYVVRVSRSAGSSFSATIPTDGTYYIILDNTYSLITDKFAHLFVQTTSP